MKQVPWIVKRGAAIMGRGTLVAADDRDALERVLRGEVKMDHPLAPAESYSVRVGGLCASSYGDEFLTTAGSTKLKDDPAVGPNGYAHASPGDCEACGARPGRCLDACPKEQAKKLALKQLSESKLRELIERRPSKSRDDIYGDSYLDSATAEKILDSSYDKFQPNAACNSCGGSGRRSGSLACPDCAGRGRVNLGPRPAQCRPCGGRGVIEKKGEDPRACKECGGSGRAFAAISKDCHICNDGKAITNGAQCSHCRRRRSFDGKRVLDPKRSTVGINTSPTECPEPACRAEEFEAHSDRCPMGVGAAVPPRGLGPRGACRSCGKLAASSGPCWHCGYAGSTGVRHCTSCGVTTGANGPCSSCGAGATTIPSSAQQAGRARRPGGSILREFHPYVADLIRGGLQKSGLSEESIVEVEETKNLQTRRTHYHVRSRVADKDFALDVTVDDLQIGLNTGATRTGRMPVDLPNFGGFPMPRLRRDIVDPGSIA